MNATIDPTIPVIALVEALAQSGLVLRATHDGSIAITWSQEYLEEGHTAHGFVPSFLRRTPELTEVT